MLLRLHVAALDPLRELDLLGGGQELVATGLAEEERRRVGRRLDGAVIAATTSDWGRAAATISIPR